MFVLIKCVHRWSHASRVGQLFQVLYRKASTIPPRKMAREICNENPGASGRALPTVCFNDPCVFIHLYFNKSLHLTINQTRGMQA